MSYSGEAADQVVRLSLNGVEVAAKLSGSAAKQLAIMIYAILKDQKKTKGKIRLTNMLRSGKELKVFAVKDGDLQKFCEEVYDFMRKKAQENNQNQNSNYQEVTYEKHHPQHHPSHHPSDF